MTKEALRLALEALEYRGVGSWRKKQPAITAIKQVLANEALERKAENAKELGLDYEPNKNEFKPDWDEKLALTEEVIRLSKRIEELEAQPSVSVEQEPVAFEEWLSNQHGDPEEIGFLQALRIAYISGQDSIITPPQRKPLSDEEIRLQWSEFWETECHSWAIEFARAIEAVHGIKGEA